MSPSSLPLFPAQVTDPKASPGRRQATGRQEAISQQNHISPPCQPSPLVPQLGVPQPLGSGARLARDQRKSSFLRGRIDGIDEEDDRGSAGDRAALESRDGGQEAWGWSPLRALLSSLHPEHREGAGSCTGPAAGL